MAPQRKIDVVLDSVKRLLRIGATANLLNLLQKQHPADLAQIFAELQDTRSPGGVQRARRAQPEARDGGASASSDRKRAPQLLADRSAEDIAKLLQEIPSDDAAALDRLPARRALDARCSS